MTQPQAVSKPTKRSTDELPQIAVEIMKAIKQSESMEEQLRQ